MDSEGGIDTSAHAEGRVHTQERELRSLSLCTSCARVPRLTVSGYTETEHPKWPLSRIL